MEQNILILVWIFVIAVILLSIPTKCSLDNKMTEGFYTNYGYYKRYCGSCGYKNRASCAKCTNCVGCITPNGNFECVPGDSSGPYFRRDCQYVEYGDPYYYYPYSHVYPVTKVNSVYPYYRWSLRNPRRWRNRRWRNRRWNRKLIK